tara:strand:+ start:1530 stop:1742 length:213 start_codon:yes stop_codon:yes gene_type:complete
MKQIEFTEEEIKVTIQLIDIAIKASGLNAAEAGSILAKKLGSYLQPDSELEDSSPFAEKATDFEVVEDKG